MEELAHRARISRYHLNLIELGRADPAFSVAVRIAEALECRMGDLYPD
jgi:DNA-binding XRE family transcriptional regulator